MRFKFIVIIWFLATSMAHASETNSDEMHARAQAVYEKSMKLLENAEPVEMPKSNIYAGQFDAQITAINNDGNQKIKTYLQGNHYESSAVNQDKSNLFVLVSFSMPEVLIKQYITEGKIYGANVVVIGLIDNDFLLTQMKIKEIIGESKRGGVMIDPNIFMTYKVDTVPAILLTTDEYPCQSSMCSSDKFDIMYGSVRIKYALESFAAGGDLKESAFLRLGGKS